MSQNNIRHNNGYIPTPQERLAAIQDAARERMARNYQQARAKAHPSAWPVIDANYGAAAERLVQEQARVRQVTFGSETQQGHESAPDYSHSGEPHDDATDEKNELPSSAILALGNLPTRASVDAYYMPGVAAEMTRQAKGTGLGTAYGWPNDDVSFAWHPEADGGEGGFRVSAVFPSDLMPQAPERRPGDGIVVDADPIPTNGSDNS